MNMKFSMQLIGLVLTAVLSAEPAAFSQVQSNEEAARLISDLVAKGYLSVDQSSGKLKLQSGIAEILDAYGWVQSVDAGGKVPVICERSIKDE